ncbi:hypothetical protein [Facilibium subflavum]|uniref:hypothetical protein n=1 Tax=Facilibium subflavum TaxID=2219058 RepID=UPI000E64958B|nr:hypothetical protein [Facilibium subflavum]
MTIDNYLQQLINLCQKDSTFQQQANNAIKIYLDKLKNSQHSMPNAIKATRILFSLISGSQNNFFSAQAIFQWDNKGACKLLNQLVQVIPSPNFRKKHIDEKKQYEKAKRDLLILFTQQQLQQITQKNVKESVDNTKSTMVKNQKKAVIKKDQPKTTSQPKSVQTKDHQQQFFGESKDSTKIASPVYKRDNRLGNQLTAKPVQSLSQMHDTIKELFASKGDGFDKLKVFKGEDYIEIKTTKGNDEKVLCRAMPSVISGFGLEDKESLRVSANLAKHLFKSSDVSILCINKNGKLNEKAYKKIFKALIKAGYSVDQIHPYNINEDASDYNQQVNDFHRELVGRQQKINQQKQSDSPTSLMEEAQTAPERVVWEPRSHPEEPIHLTV